MTDQTKKPAKTRTPRPCPICNKMSVERYFPFCSGRCANIDLNRWLKGTYAIPAEETHLSSDEPADGGPEIDNLSDDKSA